MTNQEFIELYSSLEKLSRKGKTTKFNGLLISERKEFLNYLKDISEQLYSDFIKKLRDQAVQNFWNNERELISQGMRTREWTPEQMEQIYHISKASGNMLTNAEAPKMLDANGEWDSYEGHHMLNVNMYPEYAGEYKNVQPLLPDEHFTAHNGNTQLPTNWYYDPEAKTFFILGGAEVDFDDLEYPPYVVQTKGFRSDEALRSTYPIFDELTTGEKMALRYIDKTMVDSGTVEDLCEVFDKTPKYGSDRFKTIRIYVDDDNKIIADDLTDQLNGIDSEPPKQYWYDTTVEAIKDRSDDEKLREVFGEEFDTFDEVEKYQAKRLDRLIGSITDASHPPIFDDAVGRYLAATGKQADQLSQIDNIAIDIGRKIAQNSPDISDVAKVLKKYEKIAKIGSKIGGVVDVVFTAVEWGLCVYSVTEAFNNGDYETAKGIIAGKATEAAVTTLVDCWFSMPNVDAYAEHIDEHRNIYSLLRVA